MVGWGEGAAPPGVVFLILFINNTKTLLPPLPQPKKKNPFSKK
jgi:hypothetical protein